MVGVQSYSNINHTVNFHIGMSKPNKDIVVPDKLFLVEVNKKDMVDHNEIFLQGNDFPDVECNADIARLLWEMQLNNQVDDMNNQLPNRISDTSYNDSKDEIESDDDSDGDLDNHFYNVEDMLNARVFDILINNQY